MMRGLWSGFFSLEANTTDLDISDDEKINGGGDSSDDDAEKCTNQRDYDDE